MLQRVIQGESKLFYIEYKTVRYTSKHKLVYKRI